MGRVRDVLAVADHGDAVGDAEDLVQAVGDVDDGHALRLQRARDVEQAGDLMGRQAGGRFVHDQDLDLQRQRAGDLDGLLFGQGQARGGAADVKLDAERCDQGFGFARRSRPSA